MGVAYGHESMMKGVGAGCAAFRGWHIAMIKGLGAGCAASRGWHMAMVEGWGAGCACCLQGVAYGHGRGFGCRV